MINVTRSAVVWMVHRAAYFSQGNNNALNAQVASSACVTVGNLLGGRQRWYLKLYNTVVCEYACVHTYICVVVMVTMAVRQGTHTHTHASSHAKKNACDDDDPGIMTQA